MLQRLRDEMINQENCNMLDRLATIMRTKRIDNEGAQNLRQRKSLTNTARKHQLQRITQENKRLLQRIQQVNPIIDHVEFEIRAKKNDYLKRQMSDYKDVPLPPQVETWLSEKNKLLQMSKRQNEDELSPSRERVEYNRREGTGASALRRSQSAKTPSWTVREVEDEEEGEDEDDRHEVQSGNEGKGRRRKSATESGTKTRPRRRRSKQSGRKSAVTNNTSPLRGRIRPKSGRI
jgi:hypothetical protein